MPHRRAPHRRAPAATSAIRDFEYALGADGQFTATPIYRAIDTVQISPPQNVFTDSLKVSFAIPTQDTGDIDFRYTLDGSDPTLDSQLYASPFTITVYDFDRGEVIRIESLPWFKKLVDQGMLLPRISGRENYFFQLKPRNTR